MYIGEGSPLGRSGGANMKVLKVSLSNEDVAGIIHTAVEGGTNYWGEVRGYKWTTWYEPDPEKSYDDEYGSYKAERVKGLPKDFVFVEIREDEDLTDPERKPNTWFPLTREAIERGVCMVLENHGHLINIRDGEIDTDAYGADAIVQMAVFGELVYG
jgi:hypothetical protein